MIDKTLTDLVAQSLEVREVEDVHRLCTALCEQYGFDHFLYGVRFPSSLVRPLIFMVSGYPTAWRDHYNSNNYIKIDPALAHCMRSSRPLLWSEVEQQAGTNAQVRMFMSAAREHGLAQGLTVPVHGSKGEGGLLSLCTEEEGAEVERRLLSALPHVHLLSSYIHEAVRKVLQFEHPLLKGCELTQREKDCLAWAAEGKTSWETAQILGISERTVIFHLQNVTAKLGVSGRQQAIARAVACGLIVPEFSWDGIDIP